MNRDLPTAALDAGMGVDAFLARLLHDDVFFLQQIWIDRQLDKVAPLSEMEIDIYRWIRGGPDTPKRRGVLAPRGVGKTHLVAASVCADFFHDHEKKVKIPSKSEKTAKETLHMIRRWIGAVPWLQHLQPNERRKQRDAATYFDVGPCKEDRTPSLAVGGLGGQLEGGRAHRIYPDDVETDTNTKTHEAREDLSNRVKEFSSIIYPGGEIIYIGTPHHEESLYCKLVDLGYRFRTWPLVAPHHEDRIINLAPIVRQKIDAGQLRPSSKPGEFDGSPVFTHRFDELNIAEKKAEGRLHFAMQHMLIADLGDSLRYPLKLADLITFPVQRDKAPITIAWGKNNGQGTTTRIDDIPSVGFGTDGFYAPIFTDTQWEPYSTTKAFLDPSGAGLESDEMAWSIISELNGYLWWHATEALHPGGASPENLRRIVRSLRHYRVRELYIEKNFGGEFLAPLLTVEIQKHRVEPGARDDDGNTYTHGWNCHIQLIHNHQQKELRIIDTLDPIMSSHRLVANRAIFEADTTLPLQRQIGHQLTRITRQRNCLPFDDKIDSLAGCVALFNVELETNTDTAAERQRQKLIDDELARFRQLAGKPTTKPRWQDRKPPIRPASLL